MREFLSDNIAALSAIGAGELAKPIHHVIKLASK